MGIITDFTDAAYVINILSFFAEQSKLTIDVLV